MPKISTDHEFVVGSEFPQFLANPKMEIGVKMMMEKETSQIVSNSDKIIILVRDCYVRDNKDRTLFGKDKPASINISFEIKTGGATISSTLGTFSHVTDKSSVSIKDMVVLPLHQIDDYFTLTVNMIEENELVSLRDKITPTLTFAGHVLDHIPAVGSTGSTVTGLTSELINLICTLSPEKVLLRETATFMVDEKRYPNLKGMNYLKTGFLIVCEEGYSYKNQKFYNKQNQPEEPTRIVLQFIKPETS